MITRIYDQLEKQLELNKVIVIYGPRQSGKTTLLKQFLKKTKLKYKFVTGHDIRTQEALQSQRIDTIIQYVEGYQLLIIDEAQHIKEIGMGLKLLVDHHPKIYVVAAGSASFDLANKVGEPLTGRKRTLKLYPVSQLELAKKHNCYELAEQKDQYLIYGSYPEVLTSSALSKKRKVLEEISSSYLFKDILALENIKNSQLLFDLLKLLAFQIGSEVSLTELGGQLGIDRKTVERYLDLLEKSFVLYNLRGYSRNLRKEIVKKSKYYFLDNGIRNAIIKNFNSLDLRNDVGQLWENFLVVERLKKQSYKPIFSGNYFWRTYDQKEIDWVEMREGKLFGYEIRWDNNKKSKAKKEWLETYKGEAKFKIINQKNYLDFIL